MQYRTLGSSGLIVSAYALGTMTFGSETAEEDAFAQLDHYVENGGNFIDCADVYGAGRAEEIVGRWLAARPAEIIEDLVVLTKGRFPLPGRERAQGNSRHHLRRALDASLRRLGTEHVDVYMLHSFDPLTPLEESLSFVDDAIREGKVSYLGLSNFLGWQVQKAAEICRREGFAIPITMQASYSLLVREIEWEIVPASIDNGLGLMAWSPLGGGWLTGKYRRDIRPAGASRLGENPSRGIEAYDKRAGNEQTWRVLEALTAVATELEASLAQTALAWTAQRPGIGSVIVGARSLTQLAENLGAAEMRPSAEQLSLLDAASAPTAADWPYGLDGAEQRAHQLPA